jgi:hypothetical protein
MSEKLTPDPTAVIAAYHALTIGGWSVSKASFYDEEGVEGWAWYAPDGTEYHEVGGWDELPPIPTDLVNATITKETD